MTLAQEKIICIDVQEEPSERESQLVTLDYLPDFLLVAQGKRRDEIARFLHGMFRWEGRYPASLADCPDNRGRWEKDVNRLGAC
jgi:hypothetical protein